MPGRCAATRPGRRRGRSRCGRAAGTRRARPRRWWVGRVVDLQAVVGHEQAVVGVEGQRSHRLRRGAAARSSRRRSAESSGRPRRETRRRSGLAKRSGNTVGRGPPATSRLSGRLARTSSATRERVAGQADHRGDADDVGPVGAAGRLRSRSKRAERAVEDPRLDAEPAQLAGERGDAERREEHLGRPTSCGSRERPRLPWTRLSLCATTTPTPSRRFYHDTARQART